MTQQIAFFLLLHVCGAVVAVIFLKAEHRTLAWLSGLLWGMLLWVVWGLAVLCTGLPFAAWTQFGGLGATALILGARHVRAKSMSQRDWVGLGLSSLMVVGIGLAATRYDYSVLSYDSYTQILLGRQLAQHGGFDPACHPALASWGVFVPMVHSASVMLGVDFLYALWPTMASVFVLMFCYLCFLCLRGMNVHAIWAGVVALSSTVFLATTYFIVFQSFYVHNNLPSAVYLFVAVACMWLGMTRSESGWLVLSMASFFGFILLRTEAPLYFALFAAPMLWSPMVTRRVRLACFVPVFVLTLAWYVRLIALIGPGTDILSPGKAWGLMAIMAVFTAVAALPDRPMIRRMVALVPWIMMYLSMVLVVGFTLKRPEHMRHCLDAMGENFFSTGRWGASWGVLAVLTALAFGLPRFDRQDCWTVGTGTFLAMVYVLGVFREQPYRVGWGDSANRLVTQCVPILIAYLALRFGAAPRALGRSPRPAQVGRSMTLGLGSILVLLTIFGASKPTNRAGNALVIRQPSCSEDHRMEVALRGVDDKEYAAAAEAGPAILEFDLGRLLQADRLEMTDYALTEALTDYAWHVSPDGGRWFEVYDSRTSAPHARLVVTPLTTRFRMTSLPAFRYVKLDFRASRGQNRLLMRSIRVYTTPWNGWLRRLFVDHP
jgi:hypothetical protein